jgi:hypothetical protein
MDDEMDGDVGSSQVLHTALAIFSAAPVLAFGARWARAIYQKKRAPSVAVTALVLLTGVWFSLRAAAISFCAHYEAGWGLQAMEFGFHEGSLDIRCVGADANGFRQAILGRFFATSVAFGLNATLQVVVAMTYGAMSPGLTRVAWITLAAVVCGIYPAAVWWVLYKSPLAMAAHFMARSVCYWTSCYVLAAAMGNSWLSSLPGFAGMVFLVGTWCTLHCDCVCRLEEHHSAHCSGLSLPHSDFDWIMSVLLVSTCTLAR